MEARGPGVNTAGTVEIEFDTRCAAALRETWRAAASAGVSGDKLRERLHDELHAGRCTFVEEEAYDVHAREIATIFGEVEPEPDAGTRTPA
jgi:hypothetical protein